SSIIQDWPESVLAAAQNTPIEPEAAAHVQRLAASPSLPPLPRLRREDVRSRYASGRRYTVSELEVYNRCPLQHFMRFGLRLHPAVDGGGPSDRGKLYHAILRRALR